MTSIHFGEQVTIGGYGGEQKKLSDSELVLKCLDGLSRILGMVNFHNWKYILLNVMTIKTREAGADL
ncbi:MAG: hypothetical protein EXS46_01050 [Candidatus Taylorbacteria bacterium]|nr:hypothetical protein [Candidatus Taylorbacteria bacterium]